MGGKKWPASRYFPSIRLEELRNTMNIKKIREKGRQRKTRNGERTKQKRRKENKVGFPRTRTCWLVSYLATLLNWLAHMTSNKNHNRTETRIPAFQKTEHVRISRIQIRCDVTGVNLFDVGHRLEPHLCLVLKLVAQYMNVSDEIHFCCSPALQLLRLS
jgi:hypothetical protein